MEERNDLMFALPEIKDVRGALVIDEFVWSSIVGHDGHRTYSGEQLHFAEVAELSDRPRCP